MARQALTVSSGMLALTCGNLLLVGAAARALSLHDFAVVALWLSFSTLVQVSLAAPLEASSIKIGIGPRINLRAATIVVGLLVLSLVFALTLHIIKTTKLYQTFFSSSNNLVWMFIALQVFSGATAIMRGQFIRNESFGHVAAQYAADGVARSIGAILVLGNQTFFRTSPESVASILVVATASALFLSICLIRSQSCDGRPARISNSIRTVQFSYQFAAAVALVVLIHGLLPIASALGPEEPYEVALTYALLLLVRVSANAASAFHGPIMKYASARAASPVSDALWGLWRRLGVVRISVAGIFAIGLSSIVVPQIISSIFGPQFAPSSVLAILYFVASAGVFFHSLLFSALWGFSMYREAAIALGAGLGFGVLVLTSFGLEASLSARVGLSVVVWTLVGSSVLAQQLSQSAPEGAR